MSFLLRDPNRKKRKQLLIVVRHAHRDVQDRSEDNGLSPKGRAQAKKIKEYLNENFRIDRFTLFSSPKRRCIETLEAIGEVEAIDELDEMSARESSAQFETRVKEFCRWWLNEGPEGLVVCSHGDWIPLFFKMISGEEVALKKAGLAEVRSDGDKIFLKYIIQDWKMDA